MNKYPDMTAAAGNPVGDNQNGLTASPDAWCMPRAPAPTAHSR